MLKNSVLYGSMHSNFGGGQCEAAHLDQLRRWRCGGDCRSERRIDWSKHGELGRYGVLCSGCCADHKPRWILLQNPRMHAVLQFFTPKKKKLCGRMGFVQTHEASQDNGE